jgi:pSer/pThr/pTyr-binding forkhead associated (FHA) protein
MSGYLIANDQRINLTHDETTIGRLSNNLIPIPDPTISKAHASISFVNSDAKFYIRDLSTVNGTYLNGSKL